MEGPFFGQQDRFNDFYIIDIRRCPILDFKKNGAYIYNLCLFICLYIYIYAL